VDKHEKSNIQQSVSDLFFLIVPFFHPKHIDRHRKEYSSRSIASQNKDVVIIHSNSVLVAPVRNGWMKWLLIEIIMNYYN